MNRLSFKRTIIHGVALALPLAVVLYVVIHFFQVFEKIMLPVAKIVNVKGFIGEMVLTILAILCMMVIVFVLGLLMQFSFIASSRIYLEEIILKMVPSLNHLKLLADEKLMTGEAISNWKPVLMENEEGIIPAYLIEETTELATFSKIKSPGIEAGEIVIVRKDRSRYTEISMSQLRVFNKQFGKGYITLIKQ